MHQGILLWGHPLLQQQWTRRGGKLVTEHQAQPRHQEHEKMPRQALQEKERHAQQQ